MIYSIPLKPIPSQSVSVVLENQPCTIELRELGGKQYLTLSLSGTIICQNVQLVDKSAIVRAAYTGFVGELYSYDTQGDESPQYTGWGSRWVLVFKSAD